MDSEVIDADEEVERLSVELLDELASNERRTQDIRSIEVRHTWLKEFAKSPAHAKHAALRGREETLSMRLGSGTHAMTFGTPHVTYSQHKRKTKARQADEEKARKEHGPDTLILSPGEYFKAKAMSESLKSNAVAQRILFAPEAIREQTIHWEFNGRKCRATPDVRFFRTLAELKTCKSGDLHWFIRDAIKSFYHAQLGSYREAIRHETKVLPSEVYIFAVENVAPHTVTPFRLTERALELGWLTWKQWFAQLENAINTNLWPGYTNTIEDFDIEGEAAEMALAMRDDDGSRADPDF